MVLRRGPWKANFRIFAMHPRPRVLLFNLEEDPDEETNLADAHPEIVAALQPLVQRWIDRHIWNLANPKLEKAMLERLRALGYLPPNEAGAP